MSRKEPQRIEIHAKNIDAAAGEIIGVLEDTSKGNVVYFGGWHGLGASAALKVVAQRLKSSKSKFDKVIHVDCSVWKSMRALQKAVAEELELPQSVMAIFDRHDEEDDFNGVEQGSREVIEDIRVKIFRMLVNSTFVVVFHNGSQQCIDLYDCGVPVIPLLKNKMLWTWNGRFRLCLEVENLELEQWELEDMHGLTDVCFHTSLGYGTEELEDLVYEEAEEVAKCMGIAEPDYMNHKVVKLCILYAWAVRRTISPTVVDLNTHAPNYWICDGIIQGQENIVAWEIGDSMQRNMRLDWFGKAMNRENIGGDYPEGKNKLIWFEKKITREAKYRKYSPEDLEFLRKNRVKRKIIDQLESTTDQLALLLTDLAPEANRWDFTTHQELLKDSTRVLPPEVTSCFIFSQEGPRKTTSIKLPVGMFQHSQSSKLRVLHLSQCTFNFASPPFLCCKQLRFLLLDHCTNTASKDQPSHTEDVSCFQKLWVLKLRYTNWYWLLSEKMKILMADLRELNVEGVKVGSISNLCGGRPSLVILRVIDSLVSREDKETNNQALFPNMSSANGLKRSSFINDVLPSSLESFSFITKDENLDKISSICFRGCSQLKSIVLRVVLSSLEELDLTGTAVKTLDLRDVVSLRLQRLILLGCENLCAILWPQILFGPSYLTVLHINTIRFASPIQAANWEEKDKEACSATSILGFAARQQDMSGDVAFEFAWHISLRDARLLRYLATFDEAMYFKIYMVMDSSPASRVYVDGSEVAQGIMSLQQPDRYLYAIDVMFQGHQEEEDGAGNKGTTSWIWACPPGPTPEETDWYVHLQDEEAMQQQQSSIEGTSTSTALPPSYISNATRMLHVHDSQSITHIPWPENSFWESLKWCRVERCPELCSVFAKPQDHVHRIFHKLATFWASQLLVACYIWNWRAMSQIDGESFRRLAFLHLDYCPRLIHVLPFSVHMATLPRLETLEIVCCGDLREVFPLDPKRQEKQELIKFPELRRIHLYELPVLQCICGSRMSTPNLETVKMRGCWSLRRLPTISGNTTNRPKPKVDCEKDWWDSLEWDGVEANHHPSLYEPTHSRYYKKSHLPRGTVLR